MDGSQKTDPRFASGGMGVDCFVSAPDVLQYAPNEAQLPKGPDIRAAACEVSRYHRPIGDQADRHGALSSALEEFLVSVVQHAPPSRERTTAIERAREAKMWASAAIALEPRPEQSGMAIDWGTDKVNQPRPMNGQPHSQPY